MRYRIPAALLQRYTLGASISLHYPESYRLERGTVPSTFSREEIDIMVRDIRAGKLDGGYYGLTDVWLHRSLTQAGGFSGMHVVIVGSLIPRYESFCIAFGAISCTTLEYNRDLPLLDAACRGLYSSKGLLCNTAKVAIVTVKVALCRGNRVDFRHPRLLATTVAEYLSVPPAQRRKFDAAISISSFEHDGLGRYGDPLNPEGDLESMRSLQETLHEGGMLYLAVPLGADLIRWNMHRCYGLRRLPILLKNWTLVHAEGMDWRIFDDDDVTAHRQPVLVLQNLAPDPAQAKDDAGLSNLLGPRPPPED